MFGLKNKLLEELHCTLTFNPTNHHYTLKQFDSDWIEINQWKEITKINSKIAYDELKKIVELIKVLDEEE